MSIPVESPSSAPKSSKAVLLLGGTVCFLCLCGLGVVRMFLQSSEATALRTAVMESVPGKWNKRIALRVGGITTALVRGGSRFFHLPPEPRAALDSVRGADVGVYNLEEQPGAIPSGQILARADRAMRARGWERVVGVCEEHQLVTVYMPRKGVSARHMKCCVAVLNGRDLVVVSARGNLEPLMEIAEKHLPHDSRGHLLAWQ